MSVEFYLAGHVDYDEVFFCQRVNGFGKKIEVLK